jgi:hypothetical protein
MAGSLAEFGTMPIPVSLAYTAPLESAAFHAEDPSMILARGFDFLHDCQDDLTNIAGSLRNHPEDVVTFDEPEGNDTLYFSIDMDGRLQLLAVSPVWDLARNSQVLYTMIHEYIAAHLKVEPGMMFHTIARLKQSVSCADMIGEVVTDPYTMNRATRTIPMVSIPINRWRRELETCIVASGRGTYMDPYIQNVVGPIFRYTEGELLTFEEGRAEVSSIAAQDWRLAIMENECTQSTESPS